MAKLIGVAPILIVRDIVASTTYFRDAVGFAFELYNEPPTFAILWRDGQRLMVAQGEPPIPNWQAVGCTSNVCFWVEGIEELYEDLIARGAKIDYTLCDQPWGVREFGIQDVDDHDISFGQVIED